MPHIFVSYSRSDAAFARRLSGSLQEAGGDVWIDVADIRSGEDWSDAIQQALDQCGAMLLIITPEATESVNVASEWKADVRFQVGIDPDGSTDATSADIIWSAQETVYDQYREWSVQTTARGSTVTVFVFSQSPQADGVTSEIYLDDASLTALGTP